MQNKLFTNCQPGLMPGDSCVLQLRSLFMRFTKVLIAVHQLMYVGGTFQKLLIKSGMIA